MTDSNPEDPGIFPGQVHVGPTPNQADAAYHPLKDGCPTVGTVTRFQKKLDLVADPGDVSASMRSYLEMLRVMLTVGEPEIPDSLLDTLDVLWGRLTVGEQQSLEGLAWRAELAALGK